jgi:hypothetical protein
LSDAGFSLIFSSNNGMKSTGRSLSSIFLLILGDIGDRLGVFGVAGLGGGVGVSASGVGDTSTWSPVVVGGALTRSSWSKTRKPVICMIGKNGEKRYINFRLVLALECNLFQILCWLMALFTIQQGRKKQTS